MNRNIRAIYINRLAAVIKMPSFEEVGGVYSPSPLLLSKSLRTSYVALKLAIDNINSKSQSRIKIIETERRNQ
jgi:hypothetical protein